MPNSDAFERLLQKSLQTQDFPPVPRSILSVWQAPRVDSASKWVWILPAMIFFLGLGLGAVLAPLGLGNAFGMLRAALWESWQYLPEATLTWALALLAGVSIIAFDSIRSAFVRF